MPRPLSAHDIFAKHLLPVFFSCGFIGVFVVSVPIIYMLPLPRSVELLVFCGLFVLCHVANWPMLHLRWRLWFGGGLMTPYAAMCVTALLFGSFGIPFILLTSLLQ
jgi:hypothetical protein